MSSISVQHYLHQSLATGTHQTYATAVTSYKTYCTVRGWPKDEPITARRLGDWLAALADGGQQCVATLRVYRSAMRDCFLHETEPEHTGPNPAESEYVTMILAGIARDKAELEQKKRMEKKKSDPVTADLLIKLESRHSGQGHDRIMLFAAMCLGTFALLRPNELLGAPNHKERAVQRSQISFRDSNALECPPGQVPHHVLFTLPVAKTDQFRRGQFRPIGAEVAVRAIHKWCLIRDSHPIESGQLFRFPSGKLLTTQTLLSHLRTEVAAIGITNVIFTGKCFRRGGASAMAASGLSAESIRRAGGWSISSRVWERYVDQESAQRRAIGASRQLDSSGKI